MAEEKGGMKAVIESHEQGLEFMKQMLDLAKPDGVFSEPVSNDDYTVITASEAWAGLGFGFGAGGGTSEEAAGEGQGGGGGGGGVSTGRPVAVIELGPDGVLVENVVDVTKIGLAFLTMLGSLFMIAGRMRRGSRE